MNERKPKGDDMTKEVRIIAYFADIRYATNGSMLQVKGSGGGSSLSVALNRAVRDALRDPQIRHKSPNHIYLSIGADGSDPIDLSRRLTEEGIRKLMCSGFFG
jgi:hypothetical protein